MTCRTALTTIIFAVGLILATVSIAKAQDQREALIMEMMDMMQIDQMLAASSTGMREQIVQSMRRANPDVSQEVLEIVAETVEEETAAFTHQMLSDFVPIMAQYYSEADIREIIAFYETSVGRKLIETQPQIMSQIQQYMVNAMPVFQQHVVGRLQENLRAAGYGD